MVTLVSSDGVEFVVEKRVAEQSLFIKNALNEGGVEEKVMIPIDEVTGDTLSSVLEYCKKHASTTEFQENEIEEWDKEYIEKADLNLLYDLLLASSSMSIMGLMDLGAKRVASLISGKSAQEIRELLNINCPVFVLWERLLDFRPENFSMIQNPNALFSIDDNQIGRSLSLNRYRWRALPVPAGWITSVLNKSLDKGYEKEIKEFMAIACQCVVERPPKRPSMYKVYNSLKANIGDDNDEEDDFDEFPLTFGKDAV
ncbi:hypothetical protein J5N97_000201 [Dioscorea zingiberensis]|uniref:SKP1-like protein n=1 Tax=Dioscorea zingiberensis TaxID=325984 RepID=A0A9D5H1M5_9LILI|nr:hypothetical protein J5N97_000201 [Dioscorea zingiberensis]